MSGWVAALALVLIASSATAAPRKKTKRAPSKPTAAVLDLDGLASSTERAEVEEELRSLIPDHGFVVQKKAQTTKTFQAVKALGLRCDTGDVDCLIRVGALSGANVVLKGLLSLEADGFRLDLVGADINAMRERARVSVFVPKVGGERRAAIESALTGVLKPEAWRGTLKVDVSQRGASIVVDGVPRGFAPLSASVELTPGPHQLFVGLEGFRAHKETVEVVYDEERRVEVVLVPGVSEEPPTFSVAPKSVEPPPPDEPEKKDAKPTKRRPMRVVFYDVEATGVEPRVPALLGTFLVAELRKREYVSVLDSSELRALVGDGSTTAGDVRGCTEDQCFAEVAEALGADGVVVSQLTQIEGQLLFGLRRIDQQKQEVVASFLERIPADDTNALLPLVGKSIDATFGDIAVRAGQKLGVDERAARVLNPPPLSPLLSGSLYAGTAVAGATTAALLGGAVWSYLEYEGKLAARADDQAQLNETLTGLADQFAFAQIGGFVGLGVTAILGVAAVSTGAFTDWEGYGNDSPAEQVIP
jgi:hypothetical protein